MKLGEIKLEALRIMNVNLSYELTLENYNTILADEKYGKYLKNMTESINRAINIINHRNVLPVKTTPLSAVTSTAGNYITKYNLNSIDDFLAVVRLAYEDENGVYISKLPFDKDGNTLIVPTTYLSSGLTLIYKPKLANINEDTSNDDELDIDDNLARIIPYYIKFDLYQEDELDLAIMAKNTFEQALENLKAVDEESPTIAEIDDEYRIGDC